LWLCLSFKYICWDSRLRVGGLRCCVGQGYRVDSTRLYSAVAIVVFNILLSYFYFNATGSLPSFFHTVFNMKFSTTILLALASTVTALSPAQWRSQSIYQIVTDRFARTDGSTTATCNTGSQVYCGGSWQGIIDKLDYIQGMGFTAVRSLTVPENLDNELIES